MRERIVYLADAESIPAAGVFVKAVDIVDPVSCLDVIIAATTGGTSCLDHEIHDDISKIEVVDGGDVHHSLTMIEEQALNCYERGQFPYFDGYETAAAEFVEGCHIMFGRSPRDEEVNYRPTAYKNPQLRITHALTISATAGFATTTGAITVKAHVLEEVAAAHRGFLMTKEHYNYVTTGNAHEYIDMPVDYTYRLILLKALLTTKRFQDMISTVKLHADRAKFVKLELKATDIVRENFDQWSGFNQRKLLFGADDNTALLDLYDYLQASIFTTEDDHVATIEAITGEQVSHSLIDFSVPGTPALQVTEKNVKVMLEGVQPHACVCLPMGDLQQIEDWWNIGTHNKIELDILATGTPSAATAVVIQQLRPV